MASTIDKVIYPIVDLDLVPLTFISSECFKIFSFFKMILFPQMMIPYRLWSVLKFLRIIFPFPKAIFLDWTHLQSNIALIFLLILISLTVGPHMFSFMSLRTLSLSYNLVLILSLLFIVMNPHILLWVRFIWISILRVSLDFDLFYRFLDPHSLDSNSI